MRLGLVVSLMSSPAISLLKALRTLASFPYISSIIISVFSKYVELFDIARSSLYFSSQRSSSVNKKVMCIQYSSVITVTELLSVYCSVALTSASNKVIGADKKSVKSTVSSNVSVMLPLSMSMSNPTSIGRVLSGICTSVYSNVLIPMLSSKGDAKFIAISATTKFVNLTKHSVLEIQRSSG